MTDLTFEQSTRDSSNSSDDIQVDKWNVPSRGAVIWRSARGFLLAIVVVTVGAAHVTGGVGPLQPMDWIGVALLGILAVTMFLPEIAFHLKTMDDVNVKGFGFELGLRKPDYRVLDEQVTHYRRGKEETKMVNSRRSGRRARCPTILSSSPITTVPNYYFSPPQVQGSEQPDPATVELTELLVEYQKSLDGLVWLDMMRETLDSPALTPSKLYNELIRSLQWACGFLANKNFSRGDELMDAAVELGLLDPEARAILIRLGLAAKVSSEDSSADLNQRREELRVAVSAAHVVLSSISDRIDKELVDRWRES